MSPCSLPVMHSFLCLLRCHPLVWGGGLHITLLPSYARALGFSITDIGFIYLVYGGMTAISNIYFGHLADRGGEDCSSPGQPCRPDLLCLSLPGCKPDSGHASLCLDWGWDWAYVALLLLPWWPTSPCPLPPGRPMASSYCRTS